MPSIRPRKLEMRELDFLQSGVSEHGATDSNVMLYSGRSIVLVWRALVFNEYHASTINKK